LKESSDGETLMAVYGSRFGEQQRRKHGVQNRFNTDWFSKFFC